MLGYFHDFGREYAQLERANHRDDDGGNNQGRKGKRAKFSGGFFHIHYHSNSQVIVNGDDAVYHANHGQSDIT